MYKTKTISLETRVRAFWTLVFISLASIFLYSFSVLTTVHNTVARQDLEAQVLNISTKLGEMEFEYIGLTNQVSLQVAYAKGYKDVVSPIYISRSNDGVLSMNTPRSKGLNINR